MTNIRVSLLPHQRKFIHDVDARNKVMVGGRGSGKTVLGAIWVTKSVLENPDSTILCAAPTYKMIKDTIVPTFEKVLYSDENYAFGFDKSYILEEYHKGDMYMKFKNGAKVLFRSIGDERQADRIRGLNLSKTWADEIAMIPEYAYRVVQGAMRESERAEMIGTTTPKGFNWVYKKFVENKDPHFDAITNISSEDNPVLPDDYIHDLESSYSDEFLEQEVHGKFVKFEGLVYRGFNEEDYVIDHDDYDVEKYVYGYDAGMTNPRVFLKIAKTPNDKYIIEQEYYRSNWRLVSAIKEFKNNMYDGGVVYCDPSAKADMVEMTSESVKAKKGDNDVDGGISKVQTIISQDRFRIHRSCQNTINELHSYRWDENKDKPVKEMDHALDALRYALYTEEKRGSVSSGGFVVTDL